MGIWKRPTGALTGGPAAGGRAGGPVAAGGASGGLQALAPDD